MAKKTGKSPVANKLAKALAAHATDETTYGAELGALPPGINGGIARLADAKIGTYKEGKNKGEQFLYMAGVVIEPKGKIPTLRKAFVDGKVQVMSKQEVVEGLRTSVMFPLCDTVTAAGKETSSDENVANALNEIRKLGGEECTAEVSDEESLEALLETLKENKPYFRFSTSASDVSKDRPTERVWENWRGSKGLEDYSPETSDDAVEDDSDEEEGEEIDPDGDELSDLAEKADADDGDAQKELEDRAKKAGISIKKVRAAESWEEVAKMISDAEEPEEEEEEEEETDEEESEDEEEETESDEEEEESDEEEEESDEEEEEEDWEPKVTEVYNYKPPKAKKAIEVEVKKVNKKAQTVDLLDSDTQKKWFKGVSWDDLESAE